MIKINKIQIPNHWKIVRLKDIATNFAIGGTPPTRNLENWKGEIPWTTSKNVGSKILGKGEKFISKNALKYTNLVKKNDLIFVSRVGLGKFSIAGKDIAVSQDITNVAINKNKVNPLYLYYFLTLNKNHIIRLGQGTTIKGVLRSDVERLIVLLPELIEQRKIVSILKNIDDLVQSIRKLIVKLQLCKKGLMQRLFSRGIGHTQFKNTKIGKLPKDWDIVQMSDIITYDQTGLDLGKIFQNSDENGTPYLKMNNITLDGFLNFKDIVYVDLDSDTIEKYQLQEGDFLFNVRNSLKLVGKSAVYNLELCPMIFNNNIVRYRFNNITNSYFINYYLHTRTGRAQIHRIKASITSVAAIYKKDIANIRIILPSKQEQDQIVKILKNFDAKIIINREYIKKLKKLKVGIMQILLTGKKIIPN